MTQRLLYLYCLLVLSAIVARAQNAADAPVQLTEAEAMGIMEDITSYINEVGDVIANINSTSSEDIPALERKLQAVNVRWQTYKQIEQQDIAASPVLMDLMSEYETMYTIAGDSITAQKSRASAQADFDHAMKLVTQNKSRYEQYSAEAIRYSLIPQTASQLAAVKAEEALLFNQITAAYQMAVTAVTLVPSLKPKMSILSEKYIALQTKSQDIQAAAYKPWIERIKDKVMTFAGIAILLLFFNLLVTKIKAIKTARDAAKKYGDMLNQDEQYPTI